MPEIVVWFALFALILLTVVVRSALDAQKRPQPPVVAQVSDVWRTTPEIKPRHCSDGFRLGFMVRGYTHETRDGCMLRSDLYSFVQPGDALLLVREQDNPYDPNAVLIYPADGTMRDFDLGYVPRRLAVEVAALMDGGAEFRAWVTRTPVYGRRRQYPKVYAAIEMTKPPFSAAA